MIRRTARISFVIGVLAVTLLSLAPQDIMPETGIWDKLQHAMAYTALAICGVVGFPERRPLLIVSVGLIALGCGLEVAQATVPGREPNIGDGIANVVGVAIGLTTAWIGNMLAGASSGSAS